MENLETEQVMLELHAGPEELMHLVRNSSRLRGRYGHDFAEGPRAVDELLGMLNKTHGMYYREPNMQFSPGTCIEFAWRRRGGERRRRVRR
eukprot:5888302-Prymnesium_polylepis.1